MSDDEKSARGATEAAPPAEPSAERRLARAERAFEVGDFRTMRALSEGLLDAPDRAIAAAARALLDRVSFDWVPALVLLGALAFFVAIAWKYLG